MLWFLDDKLKIALLWKIRTVVLSYSSKSRTIYVFILNRPKSIYTMTSNCSIKTKNVSIALPCGAFSHRDTFCSSDLTWKQDHITELGSKHAPFVVRNLWSSLSNKARIFDFSAHTKWCKFQWQVFLIGFIVNADKRAKNCVLLCKVWKPKRILGFDG